MTSHDSADAPPYPEHSPLLDRIIGLFRRPSPVLAFPPRELHEVMIRGDGFRLPRTDSPSPCTAFLTTRVVAASDVPSAARAALALVAADPRLDEISQAARSGISLTVTRVAALHGHFLWFSTSPFCLFSPDDADAPPAH